MTRPNDFYVGYLALPTAVRSLLVIIVPAAIFALLGASLALALQQRDTGDGFWQTGTASEWTGTLRLDPYPLLDTPDGTLLLVSMGKFSSTDDAAPFHGQTVTIRGRLLKRAGRRMIELDAPHPTLGPPISNADGPATPAPPRLSLGQATLTGEILDSKCFLGAMKPGSGRTHKACAILCLQGGIPPVFVAEQSPGNIQLFILTNQDGSLIQGEALQQLFPIVTANLSISGTIETRGQTHFFKIDPFNIAAP